jgi:myosin heavy subunit
MVVSINPFKVIDKYGEQCINDYRTKPADQLPAHLYSVAQQAYSFVWIAL